MKVSEVIDIGRGLIGPAAPDSSVRAANALMIGGRVGALVVVDGDGRLAGILSERDIVSVRLASLETDVEILRAQLDEIVSGG